MEHQTSPCHVGEIRYRCSFERGTRLLWHGDFGRIGNTIANEGSLPCIAAKATGWIDLYTVSSDVLGSPEKRRGML